METIEERAKSYAMQVGCFRLDLCAADYIAGAKEERILICEQVVDWLVNMVGEGVLETNNISQLINRFNHDFNYGNEES
jgi:hypothetical protein